MMKLRFWIILCVCLILADKINMDPAIILSILLLCPIPFLFVWAKEASKLIAAENKQRISEAAEKREKQEQEDAAWLREKEEQYKKNMEMRNPQFREMTENIFSDIRDYKISNPRHPSLFHGYYHQLNIVVSINGNIRRFVYREIYQREIEDIEREMKADKISKSNSANSSSSRGYDEDDDIRYDEDDNDVYYEEIKWIRNNDDDDDDDG